MTIERVTKLQLTLEELQRTQLASGNGDSSVAVGGLSHANQFLANADAIFAEVCTQSFNECVSPAHNGQCVLV